MSSVSSSASRAGYQAPLLPINETRADEPQAITGADTMCRTMVKVCFCTSNFQEECCWWKCGSESDSPEQKEFDKCLVCCLFPGLGMIFVGGIYTCACSQVFGCCSSQAAVGESILGCGGCLSCLATCRNGPCFRLYRCITCQDCCCETTSGQSVLPPTTPLISRETR